MKFVLTRLMRVGQATDGSRDTFLRVSSNTFDKKELHLLQKLARNNIVIIEKETQTDEEVVRVVDEALNQKWIRFADWLKHDRDFFFWRQQLSANIDQWDRGDKATLLSGTPLLLAKQWQEKHRRSLNDTENYFIMESARYQGRKTRQKVISAFLVVAIIAAIVIAWLTTATATNRECV